MKAIWMKKNGKYEDDKLRLLSRILIVLLKISSCTVFLKLPRFLKNKLKNGFQWCLLSVKQTMIRFCKEIYSTLKNTSVVYDNWISIPNYQVRYIYNLNTFNHNFLKWPWHQTFLFHNYLKTWFDSIIKPEISLN